MAWRWRTALGVGGAAAVTFFGGGAYIVYEYRPRGSYDRDVHEKLRGNDRAPSTLFEQALYMGGRWFSLGLTSSLFTTWMHTCHSVEVLERDKLWPLIRSDRRGAPLVTVCNHASVLDDPAMMSAILPSDVRWSPRRMRWGICTEEICFAHPVLGAFFGAGKALPAQRGGSIHQRGLATLQRKANAGDWVHLFAEGRVWQEGGTPHRDGQGRWCSASGRCGEPWTKVGPLKWGAGKIIANAEKRPVVVPFYHMGMEYIMPQDGQNQLIKVQPTLSGGNITVLIGDPVSVDDLILDYHAAAAARAVKRNACRERALQRHVSGSAARVTSTSWWAWLTGSAAAAEDKASAPAPTRAIASGSVPVNTVEEASDHSGASARVANVVTRDGGAALAADKAAMPGDDDSQDASFFTERFSAAARDVAARTRAQADELEARARETARDIEEQARALMRRMREAGIAAEAAADASSLRDRITTSAKDMWADLSARWGGSVSIPRPVPVPQDPSPTPAPPVAAVAPAPAPGEFHVRTPSPADTAAAGSSSFPLSNDPVVEVVPTRTLRTGVVVPTYIEAPLYIKPPDHAYLTAMEAEMEEGIRLQLYSDIVARIEAALGQLERKVVAHRKAKGIQELRPML